MDRIVGSAAEGGPRTSIPRSCFATVEHLHVEVGHAEGSYLALTLQLQHRLPQSLDGHSEFIGPGELESSSSWALGYPRWARTHIGTIFKSSASVDWAPGTCHPTVCRQPHPVEARHAWLTDPGWPTCSTE